MMAKFANIEKESLEAHVEMCAQRYESLEGRLSNIEKKVHEIYEEMIQSRVSMNKVIIGSAATVTAGLLTTIITLLMKIH